MKISLIVAMAENRVIGRENRLPWHIPEDLRFFKRTTLGHALIMGRKTFLSIGKPLPERLNIILTRDSGFQVPSSDSSSPVRKAGSVEEALEIARGWGQDEIFVIGGAEVYRQLLPKADRIYLTQVYRMVEGDAIFPEWNPEDFKEVSREDHLDAETPFSFILLERL